MLELTVEQARALYDDRSAILVYARCLKRWRKGETEYRPNDDPQFARKTANQARKTLVEAGIAQFIRIGRGVYEFSPWDAAAAAVRELHCRLRDAGLLEGHDELTESFLYLMRDSFGGTREEFTNKVTEVCERAQNGGVDNLRRYLRVSLRKADRERSDCDRKDRRTGGKATPRESTRPRETYIPPRELKTLHERFGGPDAARQDWELRKQRLARQALGPSDAGGEVADG